MSVLPLVAVLNLAAQCAPSVAPEALLPLARVESSWNTLAIDINHGPVVRAKSREEAEAVASAYIRAGYSVDLGIAQINSRNLQRLGLTVGDAFDPCLNFRAAEVLLNENYARASRQYSGIEAISRTFSLYNSGSFDVGFRNNYVAKVWRAAASISPLLRTQPVNTLSEIHDFVPSTPAEDRQDNGTEAGTTGHEYPETSRLAPARRNLPSWLVVPVTQTKIVF